MKKIVLFVALTVSVAFVSCSKDNDDTKCESCSAQEQKIEICDNGDGTFTITDSEGARKIENSELGGLTPKQVVDATCQLLNAFPSN